MTFELNELNILKKSSDELQVIVPNVGSKINVNLPTAVLLLCFSHTNNVSDALKKAKKIGYTFSEKEAILLLKQLLSLGLVKDGKIPLRSLIFPKF